MTLNYSVHVYSLVGSCSSEFTSLFTTLGTGKCFFITLFCIEILFKGFILGYKIPGLRGQGKGALLKV